MDTTNETFSPMQQLDAPGVLNEKTIETLSAVPERERVCKVSHVEVVHPVTLPFEGEDRVGAEPNAPVHPGCEVNAEKWEARVRNLCGCRVGTE